MYQNIYMRSPNTELNKAGLLWTVRIVHFNSNLFDDLVVLCYSNTISMISKLGVGL